MFKKNFNNMILIIGVRPKTKKNIVIINDMYYMLYTKFNKKHHILYCSYKTTIFFVPTIVKLVS